MYGGGQNYSHEKTFWSCDFLLHDIRQDKDSLTIWIIITFFWTSLHASMWILPSNGREDISAAHILFTSCNTPDCDHQWWWYQTHEKASMTWCQIVLILKWLWRSKRLQELKMMSPSLLIQGYLWILKLLFMIVRNVTSVSKATNLFEGVLWMSLSLSMSILVISYLDYYMYLNQPCELVQISNLKFYQGHKLFRSQCQRTHVYLENVGETLVSRESQDFWLQWDGDLWFIGELPVQLNI